MKEQAVFYCWFEGQKEENSKIVKEDDFKEAAKTAVDIWRHEDMIDPNQEVHVFSREGLDGPVRDVVINPSNFIHHHPPL